MLTQFCIKLGRFMAELSSPHHTTGISFPLSEQCYGCAEFYSIVVWPW